MKLLTALRLACLTEALSFLVLLLVAMPLKYAAGHPEAVRIMGPIHGCLFLLVMGLLVTAYSTEALNAKLSRWVLLGAVVPGVAFFVDPRLKAAQAAADEAGE